MAKYSDLNKYLETSNYSDLSSYLENDQDYSAFRAGITLLLEQGLLMFLSPVLVLVMS
jgi:hypothetical protein